MKKGISPLIATVLLIGFIIALTAVVMLWGKGFIQEKAEKEGALAQSQLACTNVKMDVELSGDIILVINKGMQRIDGLIVRAESNVYKYRPGDKTHNFPRLNQLDSFPIDYSGDIDIIPAIIPEGIGAPLIPCSEQIKQISI